MSLPFSRNRTYTSASPVIPGDLNDLQDGLIAGKHGSIDLLFGAPAWAAPPGGFVLQASTQVWVAAAANNDVVCDPRIPVGSRIRSLVFWYKRVGGTLTFSLIRRSITSVAVNTVASTTVNSGTADFSSVPINAIDHVVLNTDWYVLQVRAGNAGDFVYGASMVLDRG